MTRTLIRSVNSDFRKKLHQFIDQLIDDGADITVNNSRHMVKKADGKFANAEPGAEIRIVAKLPGKEDRGGGRSPEVFDVDSVSWKKRDSFMDLAVGDIVRFRFYGDLEVDRDFAIDDVVYKQIRSWRVMEPPVQCGPGHPDGVRVDPHDFDIDESATSELRKREQR